MGLEYIYIEKENHLNQTSIFGAQKPLFFQGVAILHRINVWYIYLHVLYKLTQRR